MSVALNPVRSDNPNLFAEETSLSKNKSLYSFSLGPWLPGFNCFSLWLSSQGSFKARVALLNVITLSCSSHGRGASYSMKMVSNQRHITNIYMKQKC